MIQKTFSDYSAPIICNLIVSLERGFQQSEEGIGFEDLEYKEIEE